MGSGEAVSKGMRVIGAAVVRAVAWLWTSSKARIAIDMLNLIVAGVFASSFVTELVDKKTQEIDWSRWHVTTSVWVLLLLLLLNVLYQWGRFKQHENMLRFNDIDFCNAYARSHLLPATVARHKRAIQNGETQAIDAAKRDLKKLLE